MSHVLITGTSSGFGNLTTHTLARAGHRVFATMRDPEGRNASAAEQLRALSNDVEGSIVVHELDVTDDDSVNRAVARALEDAPLDVVISNAGLGSAGHYECFTSEQLRQIFDVNVVGVQRVMRAVLPGMRARRQGLVIQVSSTVGRITLPFFGPYGATKFAVEALAQGYATELAPFGVQVCIVQPGGFGTNFLGNAISASDTERLSSFGDMADAPAKFWAPMGDMLSSDQAPKPQLVADAIAKLVSTPASERSARTIVDPMFGAVIEPINGACDEAQARLQAALSG